MHTYTYACTHIFISTVRESYPLCSYFKHIDTRTQTFMYIREFFKLRKSAKHTPPTSVNTLWNACGAVRALFLSLTYRTRAPTKM